MNKDPFQTDIYTLKGDEVETFMPLFNYKGFQYAEVTADRPITLTVDNLTAWFMHNDVPVTGHIETSNPLLIKFGKLQIQLTYPIYLDMQLTVLSERKMVGRMMLILQ